VPWASECSIVQPPDTGNMEVVHRYARGEEAKCFGGAVVSRRDSVAHFLMTEPQVASSDATRSRLDSREGDELHRQCRPKWWSSGVGRPSM